MHKFVRAQFWEVHACKRHLPGISSSLSLPVGMFELQDKGSLGPSHFQPAFSTQVFELFDIQGSTVETDT